MQLIFRIIITTKVRRSADSRTCLILLILKFFSSSTDWYDIFGQDLISEHYLVTQKGTKDLKVLTHELFYPFDNESECFTMHKEIHAPLDEKFTFAVHMRPEENMGVPAAGSLCENLLMEHCIFCGALVTSTTQTQ
jgi:hypothetical protein